MKQSFGKAILKNTIIYSLFFIGTLFLLCLVFYRIDAIATEENAAMADAPAKTYPIVILDAGHGGIDSGASPFEGVEEKHINLSLAKKIGAFLNEGGAKVIYTRTEDAMLEFEGAPTRKTGDLLGRIEIAKKYSDAIFISIHMNTLPNEKYCGLQTFYSDQNGLNQALARQIQSDVCTYLQPENNRKEKQTNGTLFLLDRLKQPAVLIECGFLTNPEECKKLQSNEYQNALAFTLSRSILKFISDQGAEINF